ncbi:MAG: tRNA (adenosine(37)-N6)-threonylcarbamoyltransferase complex ATPase subunit type 1 TsaE [Bacteroidetes bacterium]|jgi:tRNA threonylcarbamoyladenosine biosynthesis protein TsaE|nr:tRNA (adenosine(37)-N6)-threonylcarbamoyltransferase complex ATPase subunit type 1 TsaE [Bacteroidota bacterium]
MEEVICSDETQTAALAQRIGKNTVAGDIICLKGELGAGKTHFVKGFVRAFDISPEAVSSPTFSIIHEYSGRLTIYHFDCYRLSDPREAVEIGAEEYFYGDGVCIIEWPERIESILPGHVKWIEINTINSTTRQFRLH